MPPTTSRTRDADTAFEKRLAEALLRELGHP